MRFRELIFKTIEPDGSITLSAGDDNIALFPGEGKVLKRINGNIPSGTIIQIRAGSHPIKLQHDAGNIYTRDGVNIGLIDHRTAIMVSRSGEFWSVL